MKIVRNLISRIGISGKKGRTSNLSNNKQSGAALVVIIASITIFAILGAGILYLITSSSFSEMFINNREKAYYLAQAGRQYATMVVNNANNSGNTQPITDLNGKTFTLSGGKFYLRTNQDDVKYTLVESTGIVNEGTALETKQKIIFKIASIKFSKGVYAVSNITLGKNSSVDTYDSRQGTYSSTTKTEKAIVQTNGTSSGSIFVSGTIYGRAVCGYGGDPATAIFVSSFGSITGTPPKSASSVNVSYTAVTPPTGCGAFDTMETSPCGINIPGGIITNTTLSESTSHIYSTPIVSLNSATITVNGNVILIVYATKVYKKGVWTGAWENGTLNMINTSQIVISSGGSLELYVITQADFSGTSIINPPTTGSPATAVRILGIETTMLNFNNDSITYGGIYAPGATVNLNSASRLYGSVVAKTVALSAGNTPSNSPAIHIDTAFAINEGVVY